MQSVELAGQQPYLMLAHLAQQRGVQSLLLEEVEHRRGAVVARRIVRRPGEARGALSVRHLARIRRLRQLGELAEPSGDDRPQGAIFRDPEERVALFQLAILVAAADDE